MTRVLLTSRDYAAYAPGEGGSALALRAAGREPVSPPPFEGPALVSASLRP